MIDAGRLESITSTPLSDLDKKLLAIARLKAILGVSTYLDRHQLTDTLTTIENDVLFAERERVYQE